ncbi:YHYH protein [Cobetia marina]|uniref:YHYH protein n=1 Tax=Cobetia marina TaxID=28258 RepID=UPI0026E17A40|nr:YHYH protein [Cobetia marina]MDO6786248.1 YHYH protein [Cobetia marina]
MMKRMALASLFSAGVASLIPVSAMAHEGDVSERLAQIASLFDARSIVAGPEVVDCTLSGGTETQCFSITLKNSLESSEMGPWCPGKLSDGADKGGIWVRDGKQYDVDGAFIENLATFYDDPEWQLFDEATGKVHVTDTRTACDQAARPDVAEAYHNYCVECRTEYMDEVVETTYVLPLVPVARQEAASGRTPPIPRGIAFNGVRFDAAAPQDAILAAHTLAPFDDCGGHVNLHVGYHYHGANGCSPAKENVAADAPMIGFAMDGYPILAKLTGDEAEEAELDACSGHAGAGIGYHYHGNSAEKNEILGCFHGEIGCALDSPDAVCTADDMGHRGPPPGEEDRPPSGKE